jgi:hypothetical protein
MLGMREEVLREGRMGWSVPAELRKGDLVVMYERGRPAGPGGLKGRMIFPIIARAETDARPDDNWGHWAEFSAVALEPPITWQDVKADPTASDWPAFQRRLHGNGGNHAIPPAAWDALVTLADKRDPGAAADIAALIAGEPTPPRGPDRAAIRHEPLFGDEYEVYENERRIEAALLDLLATEGVARLGGQEDGLPVKRGNGHRIAGSSSYCDLLLVLPDESVVVVEVESSADGNPEHGVLQAARYRNELAEAGFSATACVVAQEFAEVELDRARELDVECFRIVIDTVSGFAALVPLDTWNGPLTREWDTPLATESDAPYYDLIDPDVVREFAVPLDSREPFRDMHWDALVVLQDSLGYDITPLRDLTTAEFARRYSGWLARMVGDLELQRTVNADDHARLAEMVPPPEEEAEADILKGVRLWQRDGAPYCLWYPEVASAFGIPIEPDGMPLSGTYFNALQVLQAQGYDITPARQALTEPVFLARYADWFEAMIVDWNLELG